MSTVRTAAFSTIVGIITGLMLIWATIITHIDELISKQTHIVVDAFSTDLITRLNLWESYKLSLETSGKEVPVLLEYNILALEAQIKSLEDWSHNHD